MTSKYGPFHRKKGSTQTIEDSQKQISSGEIWGKAGKIGGYFPTVKGYLGPLSHHINLAGERIDTEGVEFDTPVHPTKKGPAGMVFWHEGDAMPEGMRRVDGETIAISATIYKVHYKV